MEIVLSVVLPTAVVAHVVMALVFFNDLCLLDETDNYAGDSDKVLPPLAEPQLCAAVEPLSGSTCVASSAMERGLFSSISDYLVPTSDAFARQLEAAGYDLARAGPARSLQCFQLNTTVDGAGGFDANVPSLANATSNSSTLLSTVCIDPLLGTCSLKWESAYSVMVGSAVLWGSLAVIFVLSSSKYLTTLRVQLGLSAGSNVRLRRARWYTHLYRFLLQRDIEARDPPRNKEARVWTASQRAM
eukprot:6201301-Pleurochrysis_carterae.AAC.3